MFLWSLKECESRSLASVERLVISGGKDVLPEEQLRSDVKLPLSYYPCELALQRDSSAEHMSLLQFD